MNDDIKLLRAVQGSARADGGAAFGRISFRLSRGPDRRWQELFDAGKGPGISVEERGNECLLHVEAAPGEVAAKRESIQTLISEVNAQRRSELDQQATQARERNDNKRNIEDALNKELEALKFDRE